MTVFVADAHAHVQRLVSVVKMATVLEKYTTEEQRSIVCFLWAKGLNSNDIYKEMCPVYGGKCLSRKSVHNYVDRFSQGHSKVAVDARPGAVVAETTVKRFLCCGFRRTVKTTVQLYQCWRKLCREINVFFFQVWISHVLRFTAICDLFSDSPLWKRLDLERFPVRIIYMNAGIIHTYMKRYSQLKMSLHSFRRQSALSRSKQVCMVHSTCRRISKMNDP
jgi:hypothetical protein